MEVKNKYWPAQSFRDMDDSFICGSHELLLF